MHRFHYFIISACMLFTSCNKDEVITEEVGGQPIIELDSETGIYTVKVDHELTIAPTYQNVEDALFCLDDRRYAGFFGSVSSTYME